MKEKKKTEEMLAKLATSKFRSSFHLRKQEKEYAKEKGYLTIRQHAYDFIRKTFSSS